MKLHIFLLNGQNNSIMTGQKAIEGCKRQDLICQKYVFDRWSEGMLMLCMRYVKNLADAEELMLNGFFRSSKL